MKPVTVIRWLATGGGVLMLLQALWIPAKAELAQHLIANAYAAGLSDGRPHPPWPWADTWPVARLSVPRLARESYVLADASGRTLAFGPGLIGGPPAAGAGLSVAGHRDTHFAFLGELRAGDEMIWEDRFGTRRFRLQRRQIADVRQHQLATPGSGELQLSTCWPLTDWQPGGSLRLVWTAVESDEAALGGSATSSRGTVGVRLQNAQEMDSVIRRGAHT